MGLQNAAHHVVFAARGHFCKLCVYFQNFTIVRQLGIACTIIFFPHAAHEQAHDNGCGPLP